MKLLKQTGVIEEHDHISMFEWRFQLKVKEREISNRIFQNLWAVPFITI